MHVAVVAGRRERDLAFEIEMILAAAAQFAGQPMRRRRRAPASTSPRDDASAAARRKLSRAIASSTVEHRRQRLVFDVDELRRGARLIERRRRDGGDRLALVFDDVGRRAAGSSLRIGAMSFLPGMSAAVIAAITPGAASAREKSMRRMRACACGLSTRAASSVPGTFGTSSR